MSDEIQALAPRRLLTAGFPTEALVAKVLVARHVDNLLLYRQSPVPVREGIEINHSQLANWVFFRAYELALRQNRIVARLPRANPTDEHSNSGAIAIGQIDRDRLAFHFMPH